MRYQRVVAVADATTELIRSFSYITSNKMYYDNDIRVLPMTITSNTGIVCRRDRMLTCGYELFIPETHPWFNVWICHWKLDGIVPNRDYYWMNEYLPEDIKSISVKGL